MDSLVAQLVEHSKLNREVPGSFPGWGIRFFSLLEQQHRTVSNIYNFHYFCLTKGRHSEGPHEIHPISSQKCSRGGVCHVGVGCVMQGWGMSYRGGEGCVIHSTPPLYDTPYPCMTHPSPPLYDTPHPTPAWHTPPHPYMTHPTPPLHDTPLPTPIWHTPPHPYMTHPTPGTFLGRNGMDFMGSFTMSPFW